MRKRLTRPSHSHRKSIEVNGQLRYIVTQRCKAIDLDDPVSVDDLRYALALKGRVVDSMQLLDGKLFVSHYFIGRLKAIRQYWNLRKQNGKTKI